MDMKTIYFIKFDVSFQFWMSLPNVKHSCD
jgi:hypothetical protein